jgi:imidazolonepropionase-like amidohydrolase
MSSRLVSTVRTAALLAALLAPASTTAQTLAITGGTVIDGTGRPPMAEATVVIRDGRIAAVGPSQRTPVPAGMRTIDARGKFVIPGLMDANLHLYLNGDLESLITFESRYHEVVIEGAQIALKAGMTTVFDTWGPRAALVRARDMINRGEVPGSRIFLAGNIIGFSGPLSPDFRGASAAHVSKAFAKRTNDTWEEGSGRALLWMPPDTLRAAIRTYAARDLDFLKYGGSGHVDMNFLSFSERQQRTIVEEGHRAGKTVQAHVTSPESVDLAVEAGVDILTHGDISGPVYPIPTETLRKIKAKGVAVSVLAVTQRHLDAMAKHTPNSVLTPYHKVAAINIRNMVREGITLMVSTDAGVAHPVLGAESTNLAVDTVDARVKLGEGHFNAMVGLEEAGLAPMEILKAATSNIARAYKVDAQVGTLEPGKAGDLVILDANPLEGARHYRRIMAVVKGGALVDRERLPLAPVISNQRPGYR